jgi:hypothetical protein
LAAKCAWDDAIERDVYAGKRPVDDLKQLLKCKDHATQEAAHQVLTAAREERSPRDPVSKPKPRAAAPKPPAYRANTPAH